MECNQVVDDNDAMMMKYIVEGYKLWLYIQYTLTV